jgi:hypothetical protein
VYDIDWLAVWCVQYRHNFGHVLIPKDLDVPPAMGQTKITVSMADAFCVQLNRPKGCLVTVFQLVQPFIMCDILKSG